jgi:hypothetical protein
VSGFEISPLAATQLRAALLAAQPFEGDADLLLCREVASCPALKLSADLLGTCSLTIGFSSGWVGSVS